MSKKPADDKPSGLLDGQDDPAAITMLKDLSGYLRAACGSAGGDDDDQDES